MPIVSVIMPAYNCEKYVGEAMESILNQSFTDFEFIVIDDASTDETFKIICNYNDSRIKVYRNDSNQGIVNCLNENIPKAKGKYIARMDADDVALPERLQLQVKFLDENNDVGVLGTWVKYIDNKGSAWIEKYPVFHEEHKVYLLDYPSVVHPTAMFRKSLISHLEIIYDPKWLYVEEYELWTRLIALTRFHNIPQVLLNVRMWENSSSPKNKIEQQMKTFQLRKLQYQCIIERPLNQNEEDFINGSFVPSYFNIFIIRNFYCDIRKNNNKLGKFNSGFLKEFLNKKLLFCFSQKKSVKLNFLVSLLTLPFFFTNVFIRILNIVLLKTRNTLKFPSISPSVSQLIL